LIIESVGNWSGFVSLMDFVIGGPLYIGFEDLYDFDE